jgi:hypothetical protein
MRIQLNSFFAHGIIAATTAIMVRFLSFSSPLKRQPEKMTIIPNASDKVWYNVNIAGSNHLPSTFKEDIE